MKLKSILIVICVFAMTTMFACASGGSQADSSMSENAQSSVQQADQISIPRQGSITVQTGERGLTVEELPQIEGDIAVFPQLGHSDIVSSVVFSPDGKHILSIAGRERIIKLWDTDTGREIRTFSGHTKDVNSVAFSPDGKQILSGSSDGTIKLWDTDTGREIRTFSGPTQQIESVAFSPDGKQIASGSWDNTIKLWDIDTGREIRTFSGHTMFVDSVAFSPDGKQILSRSNEAGAPNGTIKLWDIATGMEIRTFSGHASGVMSVAFSPDGKQILSGFHVGTWGNTIKLWDTDTGKEVRTFSGHTKGVRSVAFSPDGKQIASGSYDNTVKLWDTETGREIRTFSGHTWFVTSVTFSPDGKQILSGAQDETIKLWDTDTGKEIRTFSGHTMFVDSVAFSPDGKQVLSGFDDGTIKLWDTGKVIRIFSGHTGWVTSVAFSPDEKQIASGSYDNTLILWDISTGMEIRSFLGHTAEVASIAFSPDGKQILSGSSEHNRTANDNTLKLWDISTGREVRSFSGHTWGVYSVAFSPDGKQIVSASYDGNIILWDTETGRKIRVFYADKQVHSVAFSPDGKQVLSGSVGNIIKLWDIDTNREIRSFSGHTGGGWVYSVAFSPDGKQIISGSDDATIKLWDTDTGREIRTFSGHTREVYSVAFSPNGKQIVSSSYDDTIRIWDANTGEELAQLVSFSGSDTQLAVASRGLSVEAKTAATAVNSEWISLTPDGYYQASPRGDRYLNVRVNNTVSGIDSYRSVFYNPDVVQARLQGRPDPASKANVTIQQAAAFIPPEITIQSPDGGTTNNTLTNIDVSINSDVQSIKNIKILVNGRLIGRDELSAIKGNGLQPERASLTVTGEQKTVNFTMPIELDPGNNRIEVVAFNGYSDNRRYIDINRNAPEGEIRQLPNLYLLAIGVNQYDNAGNQMMGLANLNFAVSDAQGIADALEEQEGKRFGKVNTLLIADGEDTLPTSENIRKSMSFLEQADPRRDVVVLFMAGHGVSGDDGKFYFLPKDVTFTKDMMIDETFAISEDDIMNVLDAPGNRLVFIDACQSGNVDSDRMVRMLMNSNAFVFAASRGNEYSYEDPKLGHGFFTYSVMSALGGAPAAVTAENNVSVLSMSGFVSLEVPRLTQNQQHPTASWLGFSDFPVAIIGE
jgi:WD40 repeat protein